MRLHTNTKYTSDYKLFRVRCTLIDLLPLLLFMHVLKTLCRVQTNNTTSRMWMQLSVCWCSWEYSHIRIELHRHNAFKMHLNLQTRWDTTDEYFSNTHYNSVYFLHFGIYSNDACAKMHTTVQMNSSWPYRFRTDIQRN